MRYREEILRVPIVSKLLFRKEKVRKLPVYYK